MPAPRRKSAPIPVAEALAIVLDAAAPLPPVDVDIGDAAGRILQEDIRADHDYPPFLKALMDGYAVVAADLAQSPRTLRIAQEIAAGADPAAGRPVVPGSCARIMTGAPVPPGADAVLPVEETEPIAASPGLIEARGRVAAGANLAHRGEDVRAGEILLERGDYLGPAEIAVLAACGRTRVQAGAAPEAAVLATGDEIVDAAQSPGPGRIRNSNGPLLAALARSAGAVTRDLGIAPDDGQRLRAAIERGLESDALFLSGGVSMGVHDLVGETLRSLGAEILFESVAIKPGKPFTFGRRGRTLLFGCPGNPASTYVVFEVFGRPALRRMAGFAEPSPAPLRGRLAAPVRQRPGRTGYLQARARWADDHFAVEPLPTSGSADFVSCARGNVLAVVPADVESMDAGHPIDFIVLPAMHDR